MAKKKVTRHEKHQDKPTQQPQNQTHRAKSMEDPEEKLASLKSLNSLLLKETVERRQQVESLQQSKMALESELTWSEMERERLVAELARVGEENVGLEVEKSLAGVFLASQIDGFREAVSGFVKSSVEENERVREERAGLVRENGERERRVKDLEREVREICREKDEIEKMKNDRESEIGLLKHRVNELIGELENEREVSRSVALERDVLKNDLDVQTEEANGLRLDVLEMEKSEAEIREVLQKLEMEYEGLVKKEEEKIETIESLVRNKSLVENNLAESLRLIEDLRGEIQEIVRDKKQIEEERGRLEVGMCELQKELSQCNEIVSVLRKEEAGLRVKVLEMEKASAEAMETEKKMEMNMNLLVEEKQGKERNIQMLRQEKELIMRNLKESSKQLEDQKQRMEEIVQDKSKVEEARVRQQSIIIELHNGVHELTNAVNTWQESCEDREKTIKQLQDEVKCYRNVVNQVALDKENAQKSLDEERKNGTVLKSQFLELEKNIEETLKLLEQRENKLSNLIEENKELEGSCEMLMKEKTAAEKNLVEAQKGIDDMQVKMESAGINAERALTMVKNTAALLCWTKDEGDGKDMFIDEQKIEEEIQPYVAELEAIKKAFVDREMKAEEMKRQLEFLQNSVANARKQKSFWTLVSSATTILAAASVAYVARGR